MKRLNSITLVLIIIGTFYAQDTMYVHQAGGSLIKIKLSDIDSITFFASGSPNGSIISDIDGNTYNTVTIGTQTWMAENLKTTRLRDGIPIPIKSDNESWSNFAGPAYCWVQNEESYKDLYGAFYNYYAILTERLCPDGWHIPTTDEWFTLQNYLISNGYNYDGTTTNDKIAKSLASSSGWYPSSATGSVGNTDYPEKRNASGFSGYPAGWRSTNGGFSGLLTYARWAAIESSSGDYWDFYIQHVGTSLYFAPAPEKFGLCVRCLKD